MADLYEPDFGTAFYRSKDPIKNFNIRYCTLWIDECFLYVVNQSKCEIQLKCVNIHWPCSCSVMQFGCQVLTGVLFLSGGMGLAKFVRHLALTRATGV